MMHEARDHEQTCSIALTYDDEHLPSDLSLDVTHWQKFAKRLRKKMGPFRFYHCGEYGGEEQRPHYHALIFGLDFREDKKYHGLSKAGFPLYTSKTLEETWGKGFAPIGDLTFESAAYAARYIMKKQTGEKAVAHYAGRKPEYNTMSRRPGIGKTWIDKYAHETFRDDFVVLDGKQVHVPKYYDHQVELDNPELVQTVKETRQAHAHKNWQDNTPKRLRVREKVFEAKYERLKRDL